MLLWLRTLLLLLGLTLPALAAAHEHCASAPMSPMTAQVTGRTQDVAAATGDRTAVVWTASTEARSDVCAPCRASGHGAAGCDCMTACCAVPSATIGGTRADCQTSVSDMAPDALTALAFQPPTPPPRA